MVFAFMYLCKREPNEINWYCNFKRAKLEEKKPLTTEQKIKIEMEECSNTNSDKMIDPTHFL